MILVPIFALVIGVLIGLRFIHPATGVSGQYLAVACLAGLDTVCGGIKSGMEGKFRTEIFLSGFVANVVIAFTLAWLGDQIFLNLFLAVAMILGGRIFLNLSLIRRFLLIQIQDARDRRRQQEKLQAAASEQANT